MTTENKSDVQEIDMTPIARVIGFLGMFVAHIESTVGYSYGQARPATMDGSPDHLDQIMSDEMPIVSFEGGGASDMLFIKDIEAARTTYMEAIQAYSQLLKVPGGGDVTDVDMNNDTSNGQALEACQDKPELAESIFNHPSYTALRDAAIRYKDVVGTGTARNFLNEHTGVRAVNDIPYDQVDEMIIRFNTALAEVGES